MVSDPEIAKEISELMLLIEGQLAKSLTTIKEKCSPEEYQAYKRATGKVISAIVFDIVQPLYGRHPVLKPPNWDI